MCQNIKIILFHNHNTFSSCVYEKVIKLNHTSTHTHKNSPHSQALSYTEFMGTNPLYSTSINYNLTSPKKKAGGGEQLLYPGV
jgi:hypothetical protein